MSNLNSSSDSSSVNLTTNQPDQQFAVGYDGSRRLGGESPAPFIGVPKIVVYRARSATVKRSAGGDDLVWWVEFEAENSTIERAFFKHSDTALYNQLGSVLGYDPSNLKFDTYTKFSVRPEVQVSRKGPMWTLHAICVPSRDEMITLLKEYAEQSGAMEHKGYAINPIIHDYIIKAEKPDFDAAKKAIEGLTTTAEKGLHAGKRIAEQAATALEATHDPLYATPLTPEMVKHYQGDDDPLVDDLKADGASEVEIEDTPPLLGSGGISEDKPLSVSGEQPRDIKHSTTDPIKMCFAIPNYIKRELGIDDSAASKHLTALFHGPISADKIRKNGTAATWRQVEQYVDRFRTQEQEDVTKKPAAEPEAPVHPTTTEIDETRKRIKEMGITTPEAFKTATGFETIPAAIAAGKSLKELENAAWFWSEENDNPETSANKPASAPVASTPAVEPAKPTEPIAPSIPSVETKPDETVLIGEIVPEPLRPLQLVQPTNEIVLFDPRLRLDYVMQAHDLITAMMSNQILKESGKDENGDEIDGDYGKIAGSKKPALFKSGAEKLCEAFGLRPEFVTLPTAVSDWKEPFFYFHYKCELYRVSDGKLIATANGSCNSKEDKYGWRWLDLEKVPRKYRDTITDLETRGGRISEFDFAVEKAETTGKYGKAESYWKQFTEAIANGSAKNVDKKDSKGVSRKAWEIDAMQYRVPNSDIFSIVNTLDKMAQKRALVGAVLIGTAASRFFTQDIEDMPDFGTIAA